MSLFAGAAIIGAALAAGTASVVGAKLASGSASDAADKASDSNAAAQTFQREQAENDYRNQETTRKANFDQHVAQVEANNRTRQALGLAPVAIPAYVPSMDPAFTGPASGPSIGTMAGSPGRPVFSAPPAPPPPRATSLQPQMQPMTGGYTGGQTLGSMAGAPVRIQMPGGQVLTFPNQQAADAYAQQQRIA